MEEIFDIKTSLDNLEAYIDYLASNEEEVFVTKENITEHLVLKGILYGIEEDALQSLVDDFPKCSFPFKIAEGKPPVAGKDGYLKPLVIPDETPWLQDEGPANLRNVISIPSVEQNQCIAEIIPPTPGDDGVDVFGNPIPAKMGKEFSLKKGTNVEVRENEIIAAIDGKVAYSDNSVAVLPVFEVRGDLDMKTGNIDFIGHVVINGQVPPGYTIKAGGDIRVNGLVEASNLEAGGSIFIAGGVLGANGGVIRAEENVIASYLNQATVTAGGDIQVHNSILHSQCSAGGKIECIKGQVMGGKLAANREILLKNAGNSTNVLTELEIVIPSELYEEESQINRQMEGNVESLEKLKMISMLMSEKDSLGMLSPPEKVLYERQKKTQEELRVSQLQLESRLIELTEEIMERETAHITISGEIHPNVQFAFGKYIRRNNHELKAVKAVIKKKEIMVLGLEA